MQHFTIILGFIVNLMLHQQINAPSVPVTECYACEGNCTVPDQLKKVKCGNKTGEEHFACYYMKLLKGGRRYGCVDKKVFSCAKSDGYSCVTCDSDNCNSRGTIPSTFAILSIISAPILLIIL